MELIGLAIGLVVYFGILALALWIGYLIQKAAVKNGTKEAIRELRQNGEI